MIGIIERYYHAASNSIKTRIRPLTKTEREFEQQKAELYYRVMGLCT